MFVMEYFGKRWRIPGVFIIINVIFLFFISKVFYVEARTRYHLLLVQYLILSETLFVLLTRWLYNSLVEKWSHSSSVRVLVQLLFGPVIILSQCFMLLHFILAGNEPSALAFVVGYSFGYVMYLLAAVAVTEIFFILAFHLSRRLSAIHEYSTYENRRGEFIYLTSVLLLSFVSFFLAFKQGNGFPNIKYIKVPIRHLPATFNNTVIVQLSDMHIGILNGKQAVKNVVTVSNSLKPDIVAITGDTVEGSVKRIRDAIAPLRLLKTRYGTYITTGNHDYYTADIDKWLEIWKLQGLNVLHNKNIKVSNGRDFFYLAGIDDTEGKFFRGEHHGPHYKRALENRAMNISTVLLSHRPSVSKKAIEEFGNIQLALSGHTHGGQFPFTGLYHYFSEPYFFGLYHCHEHSYVYVSTGVFYWAAPLRLVSQGEISHITLISV